jgi:hypothetical protein
LFDRAAYPLSYLTVILTVGVIHVVQVLMYAVSDAMVLTEPFVMSMTTRRRNALRGLMPGNSSPAVCFIYAFSLLAFHHLFYRC